ncbi:MAG TPA: OmpA family protein, partial [Spirochaetia bacterium]|nr:OmpA family protein [Spirochaetia bacterium]
FGSTGLAICGDVDLAYTGGRQSFVGFSDLLASLRLRAYVSPAYRITSMWSVAVQNRFVYWFNRGYMYEVLPQAQWDVVPALSLSAGIGLPVVGGNVWRFIAGVRWAPTFSAPSPSGLEVFKEGENLRMRVYFNFLGDKADLFEPKNTQYGPKNHDLIAQVVSRLNQYPEYDIVVEGHTNRVKFEKSFEEEQSAEMIPLARDRAAAVAQALVAAGIARERLSVAAIGGSRPLSKFEDKENCWKNRRVEIVLKKKTR